ncbi:MFS transporter [Candidatus Bathyarchaeota archaeon]|nr:MAG: MFS transporter [Candidatus Bathyarchaeota archaeon]
MSGQFLQLYSFCIRQSRKVTIYRESRYYDGPPIRCDERLFVQQQEVQSKPLSLWHHADFRRLWISDTISQFGGQFSGWAIPTIAAFVLGATPLEFGILTAAGMAPWLLFALPVGTWVDRRRRRPIMIVANIGRAIALASIPAAWFFRNVSFSLLPSSSNGPVFSPFNLGLLYISGTAIQLVTLPASPLACLGDAVGFLSSSLFLSRITREEIVPDNPNKPSVLSQMKEGLSVVFGDTRLRSIAGSTSTSNFFGTGVFTLIFLFASQGLKIDPNYVPIILAVGASIGSLGALLGAFVAGRLGRLLGVGRVIIISMFIAAAGSLFLAYDVPALAIPIPALSEIFPQIRFTTVSIPTALIIFFVLTSWGSVVYNVNQVSLRQAIVPLKLQGRMNATMRFLVWGTIPLGGITAGILGTVYGVGTAVTIAAFGGLLAGLWVLFSPVRKLREIPMNQLASTTPGNTTTS